MFSKRFDELKLAVDSTVFSAPSAIYRNTLITQEAAADKFFSMLRKSLESKGIVYVIGNGGSAGIASHFSTDLIKSLKIPSQTLYDSNLVTCLSNDFGYEHVFSYPLSKLLRPQDLLVAISSSGKSLNILNGAKMANELHVPVITLSGFTADNPLRTMGDLNFWVERSDYGLVEAAHFFLLHTIIDRWHATQANLPSHELSCK